MILFINSPFKNEGNKQPIALIEPITVINLNLNCKNSNQQNAQPALISLIIRTDRFTPNAFPAKV